MCHDMTTVNQIRTAGSNSLAQNGTRPGDIAHSILLGSSLTSIRTPRVTRRLCFGIRMRYWVYKCNSRNLPHQVDFGDWADFFAGATTSKWGSTEGVPALKWANPGDVVLAYQTDRNELVGIAKVLERKPRGPYEDLILKRIGKIGVRVRPLKRDRRVAAIPALQPGPIRTLYAISPTDANTLLRAAGVKFRTTPSDGSPVRISTPNGSGFGSYAHNCRVENAALRHVIKYFERRHWRVKNLSESKLGYDLLCTRRKAILYVEVKGVSGSKQQFPMTRAEQKLWLTEKIFAVAVVTNALRKKPLLSLYHGPRSAKTFHFEPLNYMVSN
jgi:hypothetical protein